MNLKTWLREQKMSAYSLAKKLGCSNSHLSLVMAGKREMGAELRLKFLEQFGPVHYINVFGYNTSSAEVKINSIILRINSVLQGKESEKIE